ncbi:MAG: AAA family ATPase [Pseudomonadota bacterium]|nr:AAA family ATPase [Pseudomonadota bacterium]
MSLIEQALRQVKRAAGQDVAREARGPIGSLEPDSAPGATSAVRLTIDLNSLRAAGYLPEAAQDREFADQYRQIKHPLIKQALAVGAVDGDSRVIMVTSAMAGDGKTFTSINLALSMARERDVSVLLIDADCPKPHVSKIFGVQGERGLLDALVDDTVVVQSLIVPTDVRGLSVLPAGTPVAGATELLGSKRMRQIIKTLYTQDPRRILLLDSAPLLMTTEGRALMSLAGQIVLVVRAGQTPAQAVQDAVALFPEHQAGGIVLNDAKIGILDRYSGYGTYGTYGDASPAKQ